MKVRILAKQAADSEVPAAECESVYAKLSPPLLRPSQCGEIVAKLLNRPPEDGRLLADISVGGETVSQAIRVSEPALWVSYVGFSENLQKVFVYVENTGQVPVEARLLSVGQFDMAGRARAINSPIPPKDKGCLIGELPSPLTRGQFVHIAMAENTGDLESHVRTVARVIHAMPVVTEFGAADPRLGLDVGRPFRETMACPSHAHGTPKEAAAEFLQDYVQWFSKDPSQLIQMAICRADLPKAWFRFGNLPDAAAMNTCLRPPSCYEENRQKWFCPFVCVGDVAKKATEPGRFLAIIPTGPDVEEGSFLLRGLAPQECRFLVCCAVASGAKGVIYRGLPAKDPLSRDAFSQLNSELQYLRPLLSIAEPVEWATTEESNYAPKSLLCGDQAILIMVFDRRFFSREKGGKFQTPSFERAVVPVRIRARIPQGITVQQVASSFAPLDRDCWNYRDGILELTVEMVDSAQVYIISTQSVQPHRNPPEGGLLQ